MTGLDLPHFGRIELDPLREIYAANVILGGKPSKIWLEFFGKTTAEGANWPVISAFLGQIERHADTARQSLGAALGEDTLACYRDHHISEGALASEVSLSALQQMMQLRTVGIQPKPGPKEFSTFDFTLPDEVTDQLIVVRLTAAGEAASVNMES
ncbi:MAG: DUF2004 domain-containing protein [Pseudomonadota bacterium]